MLTRSDGKEARFPAASSPYEESSQIAVTSFDIVRRKLEIVTTRGDHIELEMPTVAGASSIGERKIVYLDQNHWSTLAKALYRPDAVSSLELEAAQTVIGLALNKTILLPMSFAHVSETCQWGKNEDRYRHAVTLLQLSAGWQMRDPLQVRDQEIRDSMLRAYPGHACVLPLDAFTLEANAVMAGRDIQRRSNAADLPLDSQVDLRTLEASFGTADTLLDSRAETSVGSPRWVKKMADFSQWLSENGRSKEIKRRQTGHFFVGDLAGELAAAAAACGLSSDQLNAWLHDDTLAEFGQLPALGLYREALHDKAVNSKAGWEDNDLTDLFYLSSAAGYADHVVCERETAGVLRQGIQRLRRDVAVHRNLRELVANLGALSESAVGEFGRAKRAPQSRR